MQTVQRPKKKSNSKLSKQFCVRILLVPWKYQIISACFPNELFKNMYSICSSTPSFSLEKFSTDLSGKFSWEKYIVAILYFITFSDCSGLKSCSFLQFLWNSLTATFCNSLHRLYDHAVIFILWERYYLNLAIFLSRLPVCGNKYVLSIFRVQSDISL